MIRRRAKNTGRVGLTILGLTLLWLGGCPGDSGMGGDAGAGDALTTDGGGDADTDADAAAAPSLQVGSEHTLELATWNIRNFPTDGSTVDRVATLLAALELDFVAVQEVEDVGAWQNLLDGLNALSPHPWDTLLSPDEYYPGNYQKTAFLWRTDMITLGDATSLFVEDGYVFPRPPLQARFDVAHPDGGTLELVAIVVHLKASLDDESQQRRAAAVERLTEHVDVLAGHDGAPDPLAPQVVLLGDFNDALDDPTWDNVFGPLLEAPEHYQALTAPAVAQGGYTILPWHAFIDHIFITSALQPAYVGGHTEVIALDRAAAEYGVELGYEYTDAVSDHLPVVSIWPWSLP